MFYCFLIPFSNYKNICAKIPQKHYTTQKHNCFILLLMFRTSPNENLSKMVKYNTFPADSFKK